MFIFAIITSTIAGGLIVFTRIFNFKMADKMGLFQGASVNYVGGLLASILLALILRGTSLPVFEGIPWWAYLGGLFGIGIVVLSSYLTDKVSSFYLTLLIFIGQLVTGIVIDFFIAGQIPTAKIIGGLLVAVGFGYNLMVDRNEEKIELKQAA